MDGHKLAVGSSCWQHDKGIKKCRGDFLVDSTLVGMKNAAIQYIQPKEPIHTTNYNMKEIPKDKDKIIQAWNWKKVVLFWVSC